MPGTLHPVGFWKATSSGPTVSALANGDYNSANSGTIYAGVQFNTDGDEYEANNAGSYVTNVGQWLDSGTSSQVWVEYFNNTGTFTGKTAGTRYQISTSQGFLTPGATQFIQFRSVTCQFRFWDAASGGNTLQTTSSASWQAEYTGGGGPCPLCCFTPDTKIAVPGGESVRIIDLKPGDLVLTKYGPEQIGELIVRENRPMYRLWFHDGRCITLSEDHPVLTAEKGYACINPTVEYKDLGLVPKLEVGDHVETINGVMVPLRQIERYPYTDKVYTLDISHFYAHGIVVA